MGSSKGSLYQFQSRFVLYQVGHIGTEISHTKLLGNRIDVDQLQLTRTFAIYRSTVLSVGSGLCLLPEMGGASSAGSVPLVEFSTEILYERFWRSLMVTPVLLEADQKVNFLGCHLS